MSYRLNAQLGILFLEAFKLKIIKLNRSSTKGVDCLAVLNVACYRSHSKNTGLETHEKVLLYVSHHVVFCRHVHSRLFKEHGKTKFE